MFRKVDETFLHRAKGEAVILLLSQLCHNGQHLINARIHMHLTITQSRHRNIQRLFSDIKGV